MITRETLDEIDARLAKGYPVGIHDIAAMARALRSHPAIAPELAPPVAVPTTPGCQFPSCHCARACADYVRARG